MDLDKYIPAHPTRQSVYNKFLEFLKKQKIKKYKLTSYDLQKMALNIEGGIFNYIIQTSENILEWNELFKHRYKLKAMHIYTNLNPEGYVGNKKLLGRLLDKQFNEFELSFLTPERIYPERHIELTSIYLAKDFEEMKAMETMHDPSKMADGILQCGKCKSKKTEYIELQTRSGDESLTKFCYCWNCGHRWRFC